jgi:hypothetical protein
MKEHVYRRAIVLLLEKADLRVDDGAFGPAPYEITHTEVRDIIRLASLQMPRTNIGRAALKRAEAEDAEIQ